jgi:hypothetical protein
MITHLKQDGTLMERKPDAWEPALKDKKVTKAKKAKARKKIKVTKKAKPRTRKKSA